MPKVKAAATSKGDSREGKVPVAAYLHPAFREQIKIVAAKERTGIQELMAEALNLLFKKRGYEQIADDGSLFK